MSWQAFRISNHQSDDMAKGVACHLCGESEAYVVSNSPNGLDVYVCEECDTTQCLFCAIERWSGREFVDVEVDSHSYSDGKCKYYEDNIVCADCDSNDCKCETKSLFEIDHEGETL